MPWNPMSHRVELKAADCIFISLSLKDALCVPSKGKTDQGGMEAGMTQTLFSLPSRSMKNRI